MTQRRLLGIIYYLLGNGHATAPALAEEFEVSIRTIYRDVDRLSSVGIPIYCNPGKGGGIFLLDSFVLDKSLLSAQEQEELLLSVQGITGYKLILQIGVDKNTIKKRSSRLREESFRGGFFSLTT